MKKLNDVIGKLHPVTFHDHRTEAIPLPHPSGASTWHRTGQGLALLESGLKILEQQPIWQQICEAS